VRARHARAQVARGMGASASRERARYQAQHQAQAQAALQQQQAQHVQLHAHPPPPAFPDAYAPPPVYRPPQVQARLAPRGPGAGSWAAQLAAEEARLGRMRALPAEGARRSTRLCPPAYAESSECRE